MAEQTLKEKTAKGLFWGGLSNGIQQILNLVFGIFLARLLSPGDYGMVGMLAIFTSIASTIQESGFTAALTNQKEIRHEDYNAVFWFSTLTGIFFYIILFFLAPLIANFYGKLELVKLSRIFFFSFVLGGIGVASNAYLFKTLMVKERAKIDIFSLICSGTVGVILAVKGYAYYGLAFQTITYIGINSFLKLYYAPWRPLLQINFIPLKSFWSFGLKLLLTNIFLQISNNIFSVILGKFYSVKQVGFYTQGQKWMGMGSQLIGTMIYNVAQPVLTQVNEDINRQIKIFHKMVRFGAFIAFPAMFGLAFVAKEFIWILLGEKWLPSVPFLQLFCIWGGFNYLWLMYSNLLISHEKSNLYMYGMILTGSLQLFVIWLFNSHGIYLMIIAYISCYFIEILLWNYWIKHIIRIRLFDIFLDLIPYLGIMLVSVGVAYFCIGFFSNIYVIFIVKILITAIFYVLISWFTGSIILKDIIRYFKREL